MSERFSLLLTTLLIPIYLANTLGCANSATPDLATMVQEVRPGVVRIETSEVSGSGVIIDTNSDREALILTNHHVIEDSIHIKVGVDDSRVFQGYVSGFDAEVDLALLRICCGDFTTLEFGSASGVKPGSEVIAIGYPLDLPGEASVSRGIVSAVRSEGDFEVIQMDAPINPGSSGGPLRASARNQHFLFYKDGRVGVRHIGKDPSSGSSGTPGTDTIGQRAHRHTH